MRKERAKKESEREIDGKDEGSQGGRDRERQRDRESIPDAPMRLRDQPNSAPPIKRIDGSIVIY